MFDMLLTHFLLISNFSRRDRGGAFILQNIQENMNYVENPQRFVKLYITMCTSCA